MKLNKQLDSPLLWGEEDVKKEGNMYEAIILNGSQMWVANPMSIEDWTVWFMRQNIKVESIVPMSTSNESKD